ncbi:hypothetical protein ACFLUZ_01520 [Chloroflexota bacterium]
MSKVKDFIGGLLLCAIYIGAFILMILVWLVLEMSVKTIQYVRQGIRDLVLDLQRAGLL